MTISTSRLTDIINFRNGKSVHLVLDGTVPVFGSNGVIGKTREALTENAVVIGRVGAYCGSIHIAEGPFWPTDNTILAKPKNGQSVRYIYYLLKNTPIRELAGGAAQPLITQQILSEIRVFIHDVKEATRITDILSAYDDLIENNRRRIALLEEAAQLLYREWFVHFRFPGHEHVKIVDGLPEGWEKLALSDIATFVNGYAFKPAHLNNIGLPIVKIPELRQGVTEGTPRNHGELIPGKYHLKDGDLLFSWSGSLVVNVWTGGPALLNQHLFHVISNGRAGRGFLMCAIREALAAFNNQTVGATMKHIRRSALDQVFVLLGDRTLTASAEDTLENIYEQIIVLRQQNLKLAEARELLLPRLMNGEVAV